MPRGDDKGGAAAGWALPRGPEGLEGVLPPGPGVKPLHEDPEAMERMREEADERLERESLDLAQDMASLSEALEPQGLQAKAASIARAEGEAAALRVMEEKAKKEREAEAERRDALRPFERFLSKLEDESKGELDEEAEGPSEFRMKLYRLEPTGGPKPRRVFQHEIVMTPQQVLAMTDLELERRTMDWATQKGIFGAYEWALVGFVRGANYCNTTVTVNVEPPPGFVAAAQEQQRAEREEEKDPMKQVDDALGLVSKVAGLFGGGKSGPDALTIEALKGASKAEGYREANDKFEAKLEKMQDRHKAELKEARDEAYARGKVDGAREKEDAMRGELEALRQKADGGPSMVEEVVSALGGAESVQRLVGRLAAAPATPQPRPAPQPAQRPQQVAQQAPKPQPVAANPAEPSRGQQIEAFMLLDDALEALEEVEDQGEELDRQQARGLKSALESFRAEGLEAKSLTGWWATWERQNRATCEAIIAAVDEGETEEDPEVKPAPEVEAHEEEFDMEELKAELLTALDRGDTDEAILTAVAQRFSAAKLAFARSSLKAVPVPTMAALIGAGRHQERLEGLLRKFNGEA